MEKLQLINAEIAKLAKFPNLHGAFPFILYFFDIKTKLKVGFHV
jgi:hypothetical protein